MGTKKASSEKATVAAAPEKGVSALEEAANKRLAEWIDIVDQSERQSIGAWYNVPEEFMGWHFVRGGLRNDPRANALAYMLRQMGYQDAPRGVRMAGFETDSDGGLYLMVPMQVFKAIQGRKRKATKSIGDKVDSQIQRHASAIKGLLGPGSSVTVTGDTTQSKI